MTQLVTKQGYYEERGGVVWAIGKLMAVNDSLFEAQKETGRTSGVFLDYAPVFEQLSVLIERLRAAMDKEQP